MTSLRGYNPPAPHPRSGPGPCLPCDSERECCRARHPSPLCARLFSLSPLRPRRPSHPVHARDSIVRAHAPFFTVFKIFFVVFASANGRAIAAVGRIAPPPGPSESSSSSSRASRLSFFGVFSRLSFFGVFSDDPMTRGRSIARSRGDFSRRADVRPRRGGRIELEADDRGGRSRWGF